MRELDYSPAVEFLSLVYAGADQAVEFRVLSNHGNLKPLVRFTRDPQIVLDTCIRYDGPERGIYFAVATRKNGSHSGKREDLAELTALWVDIDTYKIDIEKDDAVAALLQAPLPPSIVVDSGGGIHAYWLLREPLDVRYAPQVGRSDTIKERVEATLKQLAGVFCGDTASCDITRVLRLPATHNSKTGELRPVTIVERNDQRYELADLEEALERQRPLIQRPPPEGAGATVPVNPYSEFARRFGFKAPVDVAERLALMSYMADGDNGIHQTQLSVSAALVAQGEASDDDIAQALILATQAAAGAHAITWNWAREEQAILRMIATARAKFGRPQPTPRNDQNTKKTKNTNPHTATDGATARVVDLDAQRSARQKPKAAATSDDDPLIARLGEAAIDYWQETHGLLISTGSGMATYPLATGTWTRFDDELDHQLEVTIQGIIEAAHAKPQISTINAVLRYIAKRPKLHRKDVPWDASGLIVCRNCCVNPIDGTTHSHAPEFYATWRVECDYDPAATCPRFVKFLASALEGGPPEEEIGQIVATLGEHMGASLVRGKHRNLRKALYFLGLSRSGKTTFAHIYRALFGGAKRCTAIKLTDLDDIFGMAPLATAAAWIADDVVKQSAGRYAEPINAERLKVIITGEPISIRIPGGRYVERALDIPVVWTGNNLPQIRDDSEAVYNRLLIFPLNHAWPEDAPNSDPAGREINQVLIEEELAGILNFAIHNYAKLRTRGRYDPPPSMIAAIDELRENNQPLVRWMQECISMSPTIQVDNRDLMGSLRGWWLQQFDDDRIPGGKAVAHALKRYFPTMQAKRVQGWRVSVGIELTDDGIACLKHAQDTAPHGKTIGSRTDAAPVNRPRSKF